MGILLYETSQAWMNLSDPSAVSAMRGFIAANINARELSLILRGQCDGDAGAIFDLVPPNLEKISIIQTTALPSRAEKALVAAACRKVRAVHATVSLEAAAPILARAEVDAEFSGTWSPFSRSVLLQPPGPQTKEEHAFASRLRWLGANPLGPFLCGQWARMYRYIPVRLPFPVQVEVFLHSIGEDWMSPMVVNYTDPRFDLVNRAIEVLNGRSID